MTARFLALALFLAASACGSNPPIVLVDGGGPPPPADAGMRDMGVRDMGVAPDATPADSGEPDSGMPPGPTFTRVYEIIAARCSCHVISGIAPNMMTRATAFAALVGQPATSSCAGATMVIAGDATNSVLYKKLTGTTCGTQEPRDTGPLPAADIQLFADWINGAAMDN